MECCTYAKPSHTPIATVMPKNRIRIEKDNGPGWPHKRCGKDTVMLRQKYKLVGDKKIQNNTEFAEKAIELLKK